MATADPIEAAKNLAGQTYASAQDRTAAGKAALLNQLSTQGTYSTANDQAVIANAQAPTAAPAPQTQVAPDAFNQAAQVQAANVAALQAAANVAAQNRAATQGAAGLYADQVAQAVPIEQSRAQSDAAQVMADLVAKREAIEAAKQQQAMELQMQQLQLEQQRESLAAAKEARASAASGGGSGKIAGLTPGQALGVKTSAIAAAKDQLLGLYAADGSQTRFSKAADWLLANPGHTLEEAAKKFSFSDPKNLQRVADAVNGYQGALADNGYYDVYGGAPTAYNYTPAPAAKSPLSQYAGISATAAGVTPAALRAAQSAGQAVINAALPSSTSVHGSGVAAKSPRYIYGPTGAIIGIA